ncbi:MAG: lipid-A-disaccharide synthase-related protein [Rhizobiaceae bacterium]|nr:lipid-A-disaccharide synthase-related protein [Rhizobiaceae bacterium]
MIDLGIFSNGHGEDTIACKVLDELRAQRPSLSVEVWPMVGEGTVYQSRGEQMVGARNLLPSAGFATISPKLMMDDLLAGWVQTHWRQYTAARALRGRYRMVLAVGDIIPIVAAVAARAPFMFIGCAKSYYYNPGHAYAAADKHLLRKYCALTFPRDRKTVAELEAGGIETLYLGNPMMDGLEPSGTDLGIGADEVIIGMLAGTRADADGNMLDLIEAAGRAHAHFDRPERTRFVFAARSGLDAAQIVARVGADGRFGNWRVIAVTEGEGASGVVLRLGDPHGVEVIVAKDAFADVLHASSLVIGMAGTANEQAIGLGIPLITVPSAGVQGDNYVKMKSVYFGDAALNVPREANGIAAAAANLLADPQRRDLMAAAGRERMGEPGASRAIAQSILAGLDREIAKVAAQ